MGVEVNDLVSESREIAKNIGRVTNGFDWIVLDNDPTVAKDSAFGIHGHDHSVVEYNPWLHLRFLHYTLSRLTLTLHSARYIFLRLCCGQGWNQLVTRVGTCLPSISEEKKLPRYVFIFQLHLWAIASDYIHPLSHRIEITPSQQSNLLEFNQEDPNGLSQRPQVMANLPLRKLLNDGAQMGLPSSHQMGMMMKTSHQQTKYWRRKDQWGRVYEIVKKKKKKSKRMFVRKIQRRRWDQMGKKREGTGRKN